MIFFIPVSCKDDWGAVWTAIIIFHFLSLSKLLVSTFSMGRRLTLAIVVLIIVCSGCRRVSRPNILIITIDTLRADHLGSYGVTPPHPPNLDPRPAAGLPCTDAVRFAPLTL